MKSVFCLQKLGRQPSILVTWMYVVFICLDHQWKLSLDYCSNSVRILSPSCLMSSVYSSIQESGGHQIITLSCCREVILIIRVWYTFVLVCCLLLRKGLRSPATCPLSLLFCVSPPRTYLHAHSLLCSSQLLECVPSNSPAPAFYAGLSGPGN